MYLHFQWRPSYFEPYFRYGARSDSVILDKGSFALMLSQKMYVFTESQYYLKEILNIMIRVLLASFYFFFLRENQASPLSLHLIVLAFSFREQLKRKRGVYFVQSFGFE